MVQQKSASRVGRPRGENVENTKRRRKQLIDAAIQSIVEHGLSSTTLATVARASGMSQSAAVFYFKSKETLLNEAFLYSLDEYRSAWQEALAAAGPDPVDRLVAMVFASLDPRLLTKQNLAFWNSFWPEASRNESLNAICERYDAEEQEVQLSLCRESEPFISGDAWTPTLAARAIEIMGDGIWSRLHYSPDYMSNEDSVEVAATLLSTIFPSRAADIAKRASALVKASQEPR
ncbi:MAG: TetR family transcriptional regulator [Pseudomonadota bacterium]